MHQISPIEEATVCGNFGAKLRGFVRRPNQFFKFAFGTYPHLSLPSSSSEVYRTAQMASEISFTPVPDALAAFKAGSFVVVMDDESRENEGPLRDIGGFCCGWTCGSSRFPGTTSKSSHFQVMVFPISSTLHTHSVTRSCTLRPHKYRSRDFMLTFRLPLAP
jgi:hypothetical protein